MSNNWGFTQVLFRRRVSLNLLMAAALIFSACQRRNDKWNPGEPFKTQIVIGTSTGVQFQQVELQGVYDKSSLTGQVADFYFAPGDQNGKLVGNRALTRFIDDGGVHVPADQITLQMVTIYYHLQQLKNLELEARGNTTSLVTWPRRVALSVNVKNAPDLRYDNAFYSGPTDTLYFVPYKDTAYPIPLNPGIIAHEHFHSYFSHAVLNPLVKEKKLPANLSVSEFDSEQAVTDLYNLFVLKIMNEGLADVWGWIYSQDPDFVAISLPKAGKTRNLENGESTDESRVVAEQRLKSETRALVVQCGGDVNRCVADISYTHGTVLARGIKAFAAARMHSTGISKDEMRKLMAEKVLKLVESVQSSFAADGSISLDKVLNLWQKQFGNLTQSECSILQATASSPGVISCGSSESPSLQ